MDENAQIPKESFSKGKKVIEHIGRSGAEISCVQTGDISFIRKKSSNNPNKLKSQYHWLLANQNLPFIPKVLGRKQTAQSFSYDMEFYENYENCFDVLVFEETKRGTIIFQKILEHLKDLNKPNGKKTSLKHYKTYIEEKLTKKIHDCLKFKPNLESYLKEERIEIYGKQLFGFSSIIKKLSSKKISNLFLGLDMCNVHGDLTLENILVNSNNQLIILDPNDENTLSTLHLDMGKLFQSLHSKYELFLRKESHTREENEVHKRKIEFYFSFLKEHLHKYYSKEDLIRIKFHEAMHLNRLLPYVVNKEEETWTHFLNLTILRFNEFLSEIEDL